ncbi:hypothetical protein Lalb_Chr15g0085791 [Lupinus albus]|uniref:Uncharacterized protein n=1 Tax=Lupinus albus TaxID=3870 RepID=A0A6A4PDX4_LUPAL|nr:hypothetical protein Lalb_Chr15g0085791 [Lupinus albus]
MPRSTFEDILSDGKFLDIQMSPPDSSPKKVVFIMRDQMYIHFQFINGF